LNLLDLANKKGSDFINAYEKRFFLVFVFSFLNPDHSSNFLLPKEDS